MRLQRGENEDETEKGGQPADCRGAGSICGIRLPDGGKRPLRRCPNLEFGEQRLCTARPRTEGAVCGPLYQKKVYENKSPVSGYGLEEETLSEPEPGAEEQQLTAGPYSLPRKDTLVLTETGSGVSESANFNWFSGQSEWPVDLYGRNQFVMETLLEEDIKTAKLTPKLASGYEYENGVIRVSLREGLCWSDGTSLTSEDVKYTYELVGRLSYHLGYIQDYINSIETPDETTVLFHLSDFGSGNFELSRISVLEKFGQIYIHPKHIWEKREADSGGDTGLLTQADSEYPVGSGPYQILYRSAQETVLERNDRYWGNAVLHGGQSPAPKFLLYTRQENEEIYDRFIRGEIDFTPIFISNIWTLQEQGLPIGTWYQDAPYFHPIGFNPIIFNTTSPGLDRKEVRKAIAMTMDTDLTNEIACSFYSSKLTQGLILEDESGCADAEKYRKNEYKYDVTAANALLDSIGAARGENGTRSLNGEALIYRYTCPDGWTDWMATGEILAFGSWKAGIKIEQDLTGYDAYREACAKGDFDLAIVFSNNTISPAQPMNRLMLHLDQFDIAPIGEEAVYNIGRYQNEEVGELFYQLCWPESEKEKKEAYTRLNNIILDEVPLFNPFMRFGSYQYNETWWTGFPDETGPEQFSPGNLADGQGRVTNALWSIRPAGK